MDNVKNVRLDIISKIILSVENVHFKIKVVFIAKIRVPACIVKLDTLFFHLIIYVLHVLYNVKFVLKMIQIIVQHVIHNTT